MLLGGGVSSCRWTCHCLFASKPSVFLGAVAYCSCPPCLSTGFVGGTPSYKDRNLLLFVFPVRVSGATAEAFLNMGAIPVSGHVGVPSGLFCAFAWGLARGCLSLFI